ncbi:MAG: apolipoprotein N-acyltransferase [Planctomycetaceae bacterium]|jgi:apolipoprotein N-acyltransferase|nr:apolipoprotein N-acyltransferase [Planctomycetaceae bacterium]
MILWKRIYDGVFPLVFIGIVMYLLALPPLGLWQFGWIVAAFWTPLIRRSSLFSENESKNRLKKRKFWIRERAYRQIWLAGVIFWGFSVFWVCYAYWATCFGWFAMSCYLGFYFPLFVFFARTIHHAKICGKFRIPVWFAMPIAWIAAAYLQKHLFGGFGFASLEHSQMYQTSLIQVADIGGEYAVAAVMIFVGALLGDNFPLQFSDFYRETAKTFFKRFFIRIFLILLTFGFLLGYTNFRYEKQTSPQNSQFCAAVLQGNFKASLSATMSWYEKVFEYYSKAAADARNSADFIIFPESTCIYPYIDFDFSDKNRENVERLGKSNIERFLDKNQTELKNLSAEIGIPAIFGVSTFEYYDDNEEHLPRNFNSALLLDAGNSNTAQRYDKMLLVMFGEYLPLADYLPDAFPLKTLCNRADFGKNPVCFTIQKTKNNSKRDVLKASANICFESSSPHLIREQILTLKKEGNEPDILINISNDGWFRHSSQIDMHLATHIFRAVENRKTYLSSTNGGFSVGVDSDGRILNIGKRQENEIVWVKFTASPRFSLYHYVKDYFALFSLIFSLLTILYNKTHFWNLRKKSNAAD